MNNQRRAIYSEHRNVLQGIALKKQVIGYGVRTMNEIVEAYVNPELLEVEFRSTYRQGERIYLFA